MLLEINKLIQSDIKTLSKIGWFLYDKVDGNNGLTQNEIQELVGLLSFDQLNLEIEKELDEAYEDGYKDAKAECDCY